MKSAHLFLIALAVAALLVSGVSEANASSVSASFSVLNTTVGINGNVFFNVSATFPNQTNYSIYLNSTKIYSSSFQAGYNGYKIVAYNVSNRYYGLYQPSVRFSIMNAPLDSNTSLYVKPTSGFGFVDYTNITEEVNNTASIMIKILNSGNTPLNFSWFLPVIKGISISLNFNQSFRLFPGGIYSIPIHFGLSNSYQSNISFQFSAKFMDVMMTKNYTTSIIKPVVNFTLESLKTAKLNSTTQLWYANILNFNNVPINATLEFLLSYNNSRFYYNKSYLITPSTKNISVLLPESKILSVTLFYPSSSLATESQELFSAPQPTASILSGLSGGLGYIVLTVLIIVVFVVIHLRVNRRKR